MTKSTALARTASENICQTLDKMQGSFSEALNGTGVSVKRFLATAKTAVQTHTDQKGLEAADRNSLYLAIKKAAGDGLVPDNREAALVIYNTKQKDGTWVKQVQYQPMVQGLVKLARKSGEIEKIGAFIVYKKDSFRFEVGIDDIPRHSAPQDENGNHLWFSADRGKAIGVWAFVKLKSGEYIDPVMLSEERIKRIATRSKIAGNYDSTGKLKDKYGNIMGRDWEEWWKKAAIRNVLKYAPKSTSLEQAISETDNEFDFSKESIDLDPDPVNPVSNKKKTESKAAAVVKAKAAAKKQPEPMPDEHGEIIDVEATIVNSEPEDDGDEVEEIPV